MPDLAEALGIDPASLLAPARRLVATRTGGARLADGRPRSPRAPRPAADPAPRACGGAASPRSTRSARCRRVASCCSQGVAASGQDRRLPRRHPETLEAGRGAIVLVPEVSLVPQLADRLRAIVGDELAVLHSGLSAGERHDEWWRDPARRGARRGRDADGRLRPARRRRLIVLDEEHDGGYKSDRTPRYDARWVARRRAALAGARLVLGSATPDLVTLARVRGGPCRARHARRATGRRRSGDRGRRPAGRAGRRATGRSSRGRWPRRSATLRRGTRAGGPAHQPSRRGDLHPVPRLRREPALPGLRPALRLPPRRRNAALPPLWSDDRRPAERCPSCGSARIRYFGAGTQRVEAELRPRFPACGSARLDSDALAARRGLRVGLRRLPRGPRSTCSSAPSSPRRASTCRSVTLAAVVAADVTLNLPDYRAARADLPAAGAGRRSRRTRSDAGSRHHPDLRSRPPRGPRRGRARRRRLRRRGAPAPTAARLSAVQRPGPAAGRRCRIAPRRGARPQAAAAVAASTGVEVLGPLPAYVARRAGRYRFQVVVRAPDAERRVPQRSSGCPPGVAIDVDPESLL